MMEELFIFITAIVFTGVGYYFGVGATVVKASENALDILVKGGYLRYRRDKNGEIEIMKWNTQDD